VTGVQAFVVGITLEKGRGSFLAVGSPDSLPHTGVCGPQR